MKQKIIPLITYSYSFSDTVKTLCHSENLLYELIKKHKINRDVTLLSVLCNSFGYFDANSTLSLSSFLVFPWCAGRASLLLDSNEGLHVLHYLSGHSDRGE